MADRDQSRGPIPSDGVPSQGRRRRKERSAEKFFRARLWLVGLWFLLRVTDVAVYFSLDITNQALPGLMVSTFLWSTVLLIAIGFRQSWARYFLFALQLLGGVLALAGSIYILAEGYNGAGTVFLVGLLYSVVAWILITSPDIKRLTCKTYV